jgi:hypothetical protein
MDIKRYLAAVYYVNMAAIWLLQAATCGNEDFGAYTKNIPTM